jgi:hypothetical protein
MLHNESNYELSLLPCVWLQVKDRSYCGLKSWLCGLCCCFPCIACCPIDGHKVRHSPAATAALSILWLCSLPRPCICVPVTATAVAVSQHVVVMASATSNARLLRCGHVCIQLHVDCNNLSHSHPDALQKVTETRINPDGSRPYSHTSF